MYSLEFEHLLVIKRKAYDLRIQVNIFLKKSLPFENLLVIYDVTNDNTPVSLDYIALLSAERRYLGEVNRWNILQ